ncbi:MAG: group 1 truncated hemoglobin [Microbacteriaceae bacterium]|nr:group 1 truncated hemoglobin [Microbacteriaceae bacterium]
MSIYDAIGGREAVRAAVDLFYVKVTGDPLLAPWFARSDMERLKAHQRRFIGAALGGPEAYDGLPMKQAHAPMRITDEAFDAVAGHLAATLAELGVPGPTVDEIVASIAPLRTEIVTVVPSVPAGG